MSKNARTTYALKPYEIACPNCGTENTVALPMGCYSRPTDCEECGNRWDATP